MLAVLAAVTLRIATLAPPGSGWDQALQAMAADVSAKTSGRVAIAWQPMGIDADQGTLVHDVLTGKLDGAELTSVGLEQVDPSIAVLDLPFFFDSPEMVVYVRAMLWPTFEKRFLAKGLVLAGPGDLGWQYAMGSVPMTSIADLRAAKVWLRNGDPTLAELERQLGVKGAAVWVRDVDAALAKRALEVCYGAPLMADALGWRTEINVVLDRPIDSPLIAIVIAKPAWDQLANRDRIEVGVLGFEVAREIAKLNRRDNGSIALAMARLGATLVSPDATMDAALCTAAQQTWTTLAGTSYSQRDLNDVLQQRAAFLQMKGGAPRCP